MPQAKYFLCIKLTTPVICVRPSMAIPKYALLSVASVPGDSPTNEKTSRNLRIGLSHERERFNYKPLVLRTFSLSSLLVLTLALIGLLEYAAIELPHSGYHTDRKREVRSPANFDRRQDRYGSSFAPATLMIIRCALLI